MTANVFTYLKQNVDPTLASVNENASFFENEFINLFPLEEYKGDAPAESGFIDIWQSKAFPNLHIGDKWGYQHGTKNVDSGQIKFKKMTISHTLSEDELNRIQKRGVENSVIANMLAREQKETYSYLATTIEKWIIDPWGGATTDQNYDASFQGLLVASSTGSLSLPSDLNATAGTASNQTAVILSGGSKTLNAHQALLADVRPNMTKIDAITKREFRFDHLYWLVNPIVYDILKSNYPLMNSTTGQVSDKNYVQHFNEANVTVIKSPHISYTYATTEETTGIWFTDPTEWFKIFTNPPPEGEGWSEWEKIPNVADGITTYTFEKHRKLEFALMCQAFWLNTSTTAGYWFKPVYRQRVTPYTA